jgi:hypothetical protein
MSWVIYLKFLFTRKFVLIEFLTLNYIIVYFWFAIWLSYQLFNVLKLTLGKIIIFTNFPLFSTFQCEPSRRTWLTVRTHVVLSIASLASGLSKRIGNMSRRDPYRLLSVSLLSLPSAHHYIFIDLLCHVVCLSRGFLPRFWHSLHISPHSMIFVMSSFILLSFCAS